MDSHRIVVVGSVNADMVVKTKHLPEPGETVTGGQFVMAPGGKGANQAVAAARLRADVTLIARVGSDAFGDQALERYGQEGIRTEHIIRDADSATGVALILVDHGGENLISVASGANHALTPKDIDAVAPVIQQADVLLLQLEIPMNAVERAAAIAHEAGVLVILDPAPAAPLGTELLKCVSVLTPNESEASQLTDTKVLNESSARTAADSLLKAGAGSVVITLGPKGAWMATEDGGLYVAGRSVKAVDSTAAGDAFNGGLGLALARGESLEDAVRWASLVGALSVQKMGAQPSLPTAADVAAYQR